MQRRGKQLQPADLKERAVGVALRKFRENAGQSQERLSAECGFDRTYISRVERGIINPTIRRLWKIADVLRLPLSQIVKRMETWASEEEKARMRRTASKP